MYIFWLYWNSRLAILDVFFLSFWNTNALRMYNIVYISYIKEAPPVSPLVLQYTNRTVRPDNARTSRERYGAGWHRTRHDCCINGITGQLRAGTTGHTLFLNSIFVYTLIRGIGMVAPAKRSKHRKRSQWSARDIRYSGPSSYDRPDIRTTWATTKILVLTYDQNAEWVTTQKPVKAKTCIRVCGCKQRPQDAFVSVSLSPDTRVCGRNFGQYSALYN
jgi:hypothetical protein